MLLSGHCLRALGWRGRRGAKTSCRYLHVCMALTSSASVKKLWLGVLRRAQPTSVFFFLARQREASTRQYELNRNEPLPCGGFNEQTPRHACYSKQYKAASVSGASGLKSSSNKRYSNESSFFSTQKYRAGTLRRPCAPSPGVSEKERGGGEVRARVFFGGEKIERNVARPRGESSRRRQGCVGVTPGIAASE